MADDLFAAAAEERLSGRSPLAARLRPRNLDDMYGQDVVELVHDLRHHINLARSDQ